MTTWSIPQGHPRPTLHSQRMISGTNLLAILVSFFLISRLLKYRSTVARFERNGIPCMTCAFGIFTPVGILFPTVWWWNPSIHMAMKWKNQFYEIKGQDTIGIIPLLFGKPCIYTRSMEAFKQVALPVQSHYIKNSGAKRVLRIFGDNVVSTDGSDWKRHRRITQPAFNQKTYDVVWSETSRLYHEMLDVEGWMQHDGPIHLPSINFIGFRLALSVIASVAFGITFSWSQPPSSLDMTLQEAFRIFASSTFQRLLIPKWIFKLPIDHLRKIDTAYAVMDEFMDNTILKGKNEARLMASSGETAELLGDTVFSRLIAASEKEAESGTGLNDIELRGNVWAILFAGHETTAHTLSATFAYLALYPEVQQEIYEVIKDVTADGHEPIVDDFDRLDRVTACFLEAIRFCPSGSMISRDTSEDIVLDLPKNSNDKDGIIQHYALEKDIHLVVDLIGLNYNPAYFPQPEEYRPSRWYSESTPSDQQARSEHPFTSFSAGPRVCIGKKFAVVEATCFLTYFLRDFEVRLGDYKPGKTREEWKEKHLKYRLSFTLHPGDIPITIIKRE